MDIKDILSMFQMGSITVAAFTTIYGVNAWRRQLIGGKRAEVAEKAITQFYEAKDIIISARSPMSGGSEGKKRATYESEKTNPDLSSTLNAFWAPAERLLDQTEFFSSLNASRYRFRAYFGDAAEGSFKKVFDARSKILVSARMLVMTHAQQGRREPNEASFDRWEKWEADIWWTDQENDAISISVDEAIIEMEAICAPILERGNPGFFENALGYFLKKS